MFTIHRFLPRSGSSLVAHGDSLAYPFPVGDQPGIMFNPYGVGGCMPVSLPPCLGNQLWNLKKGLFNYAKTILFLTALFQSLEFP